MNKKQILGIAGEQMVAKYLKKQKYKIIATNYTCPVGELDLIALDKDTYVFIEVKTRTSFKYGLPREAVDEFKRRKIERLAQYYMNLHNLNSCLARFDVIEVFDTDINHIKNAWNMGEWWKFLKKSSKKYQKNIALFTNLCYSNAMASNGPLDARY